MVEYPPILWRHNKVAARAYFNLYNGEMIKSSHIKQKGTQHVYMYKSEENTNDLKTPVTQ